MSKAAIQNVLLVLLTVTSGCVDAISFLGLGQVFTAAMTGNTVLFGLAVAHANGLQAIHYAAALLGFILGAALAALALRRLQTTTGWNSAVTWTISFELLALVIFGVVASLVGNSPQGGLMDILIILLGMAMGVQGVVARRAAVTGVTTTVITSTLTGLVESVVWNLQPSSLTTLQGVQPPKTKTSSITMWISVIVAYGIGAGICGGVELRWHLQAVWLPVTIVAVVMAVGGAVFQAAERRETAVGQQASS